MSSDSLGTPKWIIYVGGFASIATIIGVIITFSQMKPSPTPPVSAQSLSTQSPTQTPKPIWNVIVNSSVSELTYNNFTVTDTVNTHFLVIDASFENQSSESQALSGKLFDLQDS